DLDPSVTNAFVKVELHGGSLQRFKRPLTLPEDDDGNVGRKLGLQSRQLLLDPTRSHELVETPASKSFEHVHDMEEQQLAHELVAPARCVEQVVQAGEQPLDAEDRRTVPRNVVGVMLMGEGNRVEEQAEAEIQ